MWAKIEVIPSDIDIIFIPASVKIKHLSTISIIFGKKEVPANYQYDFDMTFDESTFSFERPATIRISEKLRDKLLIPDSLTYQIKFSDSNITIGPTIGFLLGMNTYHYNPIQMKKYSDRFDIYNKIGGLIYAFSPRFINWKNKTAYGLFYNTQTSSWDYGLFPLPEVIYRRNFHLKPDVINKLIEITDGRVFNSYRFTKFELFDFVEKAPQLKNFLPATELFQNFEQVKQFIDDNSKAILKPIDLSRGRGICIIEKLKDKYKITDYRYKTPNIYEYDDNMLKEFFNSNDIFKRRYIIQKYLHLAKVDNSLFDIRVVMQKLESMDWKCSGIECRVSKRGSHITNISRGGYALCLDEALCSAFDSSCEDLKYKINEFCQKFCLYMDTWGKHFAEFGMDIGVDEDKNIWLIEANVFPSFKGFKKMCSSTYKDIRYAPLLYALSLTCFGEQFSQEVDK